jgi:hypothetical protein
MPKQVDFINSTARYTLFSGAVRAGKTIALAYFGLMRAMPNTVGLLGAYTFPMIDDAIIPALMELLACYPSDMWTHDKSKNNIFIHHPEGDAKIMLRYLQREGRLRGFELNWFAIDEATVGLTEETNTQLKARLSAKNAQGAYACNPDSMSHWIYEEFFNAPDQAIAHTRRIETNVYDNPYLPAEYLQDLERRPAFWKRRFMEGKWGTMQGAVYPTFYRKTHVEDFGVNKNWRLYMLIDHGFEGYWCCLLVGIENDERMYVFDEIYEGHVLPAQRAKDARALWAEHGLPFDDAGDPDGRVIMDNDPRTDRELMQQLLGMPADVLWKGGGSVKSGISKVRILLENTYDGRPRLLIHPRCKNTIREMESYTNRTGQGGRYLDSEPVKANDHAMDALRYGVITIFTSDDMILPGI